MHETRKDVEHNNVNGKLGNMHLHFQEKIERCWKTSLHYDCTVTTSPHHFNPLSLYDCCIPHSQELIAKAPNKTCDVV